MKIVTRGIILICLIAMILPASSSAAKQQGFQTKLDSLISDVLTDLDGIAEGFEKAGKVTDARKYTATALLLRTYGNGHIIDNREDFDIITGDIIGGQVTGWLELINGRSISINKKTIENYKDVINKRMYFVVKHQLKVGTKELIPGYPAPRYQIILRQIDLYNRNKTISKFELSQIPEGYVFEGLKGIEQIKSLYVDASAELVNTKIRWYDPKTDKYIASHGLSTLDSNSIYMKSRVYNPSKALRFQVIYNKYDKTNEIVLNDVHHLPLPLTIPSTADHLVGVWNVNITKSLKTQLIIDDILGDKVYGRFVTANGTYKAEGTAKNKNVSLKLLYTDAEHIKKELAPNKLPQADLDRITKELLSGKHAKFYRELSFKLNGTEKSVVAKYQPWEMRLKKNGNSNNVFSVTRGATVNVPVSKVERGT